MKLSIALLTPLLVTGQEIALGTGARLIQPRHSGNGCPSGSTNITMSASGDWITITHSKFRTYIGPSYPPAEKTKNCQVQLPISAPSAEHFPQGVKGVQYTLAGTEYEGYYSQLDEGVTAIHYSTYYSNQMDTYTATTIARFDGGETWRAPGRSYNESRMIPLSSLAYTYCARPGATAATFYANERVAMNSSNPQAYGVSFAGEAVDLLYTRRIRVLWRACTP
ncbi:hypothetical protein QBC41DRAFT_399083, partial [Cercophora samala]